MRRSFFRQIATIILLAASIVPAVAATRGWESVKTERSNAKTVTRVAEFEIKAASGVIIISTNHSQQVKIFTILGRLVSSDSIPAGTSQFLLPAHGVYIVKIGDVTCKVAV